MPKGTIDVFVMVILAILVGMIAIAAVFMKSNPISTPKAASMELSTKIAMYADALSTLEDGTVTIDAGKNKYDIELCSMDSTRTIIKEKIASLFRDSYKGRTGFYVTVVPYDKDGKKNEDAATAFILKSYQGQKGCRQAILGVSKVCMIKESGKQLAEVKGC